MIKKTTITKTKKTKQLKLKPFDLLDINTVRPIVAEVLKYKPSGSALDLGSASGRHSLFLAKNGFKVTAVDYARELLAGLKELARLQNLPIKLVYENLAKFQTKQKFDVVLNNMVLHFIAPKAHSKIIKMMQEATKRGGINVVSVYTDRNPQGTKPYMLKAGSLKRAYEKAGWKILDYYEGSSKRAPRGSIFSSSYNIWKEEIIAQKP